MDPRKLKRLLDTFRAAGVSKVLLDEKLQPTSVEFGALPLEVPRGDVSGLDTDDSWKTAPSGLLEAVQRIQQTYAPKQKGRAS